MLHPILKSARTSFVFALVALFIMVDKQSQVSIYIAFPSLMYCLYNALTKYFMYLEVTRDSSEWQPNTGDQPALFNVDVVYSRGNTNECVPARKIDWSCKPFNPVIAYRVSNRGRTMTSNADS